jgi:hypothetical protein
MARAWRWPPVHALANTTSAPRLVCYGSDLFPLFNYVAWGLQLTRSPDGASLAIGTSDTQQDIWIVDAFAP